MKTIMSEKATSMQTDAIMGYVRDEKLTLNVVTCISTFSNQFYKEFYFEQLLSLSKILKQFLLMSQILRIQLLQRYLAW